MEVNWIAIIVAALIPMVMGFLWYGPIFGKQWQSSMGFSDEDLKSGNMPVIFGISFVMAILMAMGIFFFIEGMHEAGGGSFHTFKHGALHGAMVSIFFSIPVLVSNSLFQKNNAKNILINIGYWVVTSALMGGILDMWQ